MAGYATVVSVDRANGIVTVGGNMDRFLEAKCEEMDALYKRMSDSFRRTLYEVGDDVVIFEIGQTITFSANGPTVAVATGIGAAVAVAGIGWIIARRNALAGTEEVSESWVKALAEWCVQFVRRLFALNQTPQLGEGER